MKEPLVGSCAWCGKRVEPSKRHGLRTRFRKNLDWQGEDEKIVRISIFHLGRLIPALARRLPCELEEAAQLIFQTCSQRCSQVLYQCLRVERELFSVARFG